MIERRVFEAKLNPKILTEPATAYITTILHQCCHRMCSCFVLAFECSDIYIVVITTAREREVGLLKIQFKSKLNHKTHTNGGVSSSLA